MSGIVNDSTAATARGVSYKPSRTPVKEKATQAEPLESFQSCSASGQREIRAPRKHDFLSKIHWNHHDGELGVKERLEATGMGTLFGLPCAVLGLACDGPVGMVIGAAVGFWGGATYEAAKFE